MDSISKKAFWITTIIFIILLIAIGVGSWYYFDSGEVADCKDTKTSKCDEVQYQQYRYKLTEYGEIGKQDQFFSQYDKETEAMEVMAESINKTVPNLDGNLLMLFAQPYGSDIVILASYLPDTDSPWSKLYSFNPDTKKFTYMTINDIYHGPTAGFLKHIDETKLVYIPNKDSEDGNNQKLYLIDLINDTSKGTVTLTGDETFNAGKSALSYCFDLSWKDNDTVEYAVFDQSKKTDLESCPDKVEDIPSFIEYRTLDI